MTKTLIQALLIITAVHLLATSVHNVSPGVAYALRIISVYAGLPFGLSCAIAINGQTGMALPGVVLVLLIASPSTIELAATVLAPYGIGIAVGSAIKGMTEKRPYERSTDAGERPS